MFYIKFISASKEHILWLRSKIKNLLHISGDLSRGGKTPVYQLKYAKRESKILLSKMYYKESLPYFKRKYKKLKSILNIDQIETERENRNIKSDERVLELADS